MIAVKRTKIVCTIGPASNNKKILCKMIQAGMNVARLNFSHAEHHDHLQLIKTIRTAERTTGEPVTLLGDLSGPKIRVGELPASGIELRSGQTVELPVNCANLYQEVKKGHRVLLKDGLIAGSTIGGRRGWLKLKIEIGGLLLSHQGLNFPDSVLTLPAFTDKDRFDAEFAVEQGMQWLALSFVANPQDVRRLRIFLSKIARRLGRPVPKIIVKIERNAAVENFSEILREADGVMIARGDLAVEIAAERVPVLQKEMISQCRAAAKPVIVATQMLGSMVHQPRPTRAEVSDVANAVIDHTDAVMLSEETATGEYPLAAVEIMSRVIIETEASRFDDVPISEGIALAALVSDFVGGTVSKLAETMAAKLILVSALTGQTVCQVSRFRPELPIVAVTTDPFVQHQLNLSWAVRPLLLPRVKEKTVLIKRSLSQLTRAKIVRPGDKVIVMTAGVKKESFAMIDLVEIKK